MPSPTSSELVASEPILAELDVAPCPTVDVAARWVDIRWIAFGLYLGAAYFQYRHGMPWSSNGIPLRDREILIGWFLVGSVVWSLGRSRREMVYAIVGWGALAGCFVLYDYTRGAVDNLWGHAVGIPGSNGAVPAQSVHNAERILTAERALFFGQVPTEWLQNRLYQPGRSGPRWEIVTGLTYLSHFVVVYFVALVQWMRDRVQWVKWVRALVTLIVLGVAGYFLFPTAPPWLADRYGLMRSVYRPGTRGLRHIHLEIADRIWTSKSRGSYNIVAAMPSLHFAFTALVMFFFWRTAKPWFRVVLATYSGLMFFTLVYSGEHYVLDCLIGGLLAWFAVWANRRFDMWWTRRADAPSDCTLQAPTLE